MSRGPRNRVPMILCVSLAGRVSRLFFCREAVRVLQKSAYVSALHPSPRRYFVLQEYLFLRHIARRYCRMIETGKRNTPSCGSSGGEMWERALRPVMWYFVSTTAARLSIFGAWFCSRQLADRAAAGPPGCTNDGTHQLWVCSQRTRGVLRDAVPTCISV